jgi:Tfp pilus assembly protein PilN
MMQRVHIDYIRQYDGQYTLMRWCAVVILLACLIAAVYWQQLRLETQANSLPANAPLVSQPVSLQATVLQQQETKALNVVHGALHQDWSSLFHSLEQSFTKEIGIIEISPDIQRKTVNITAVALNTEHMMRYIQSLSSIDFFQTVQLISNEAHEVQGVITVRFELEATWKN